MQKFKQIIKKILYPNICLFILFTIIGYGSVIATFLFGYNETPIGYITYILSAYALIITVIKIPKVYRGIYNFFDNIKFTNKLIHDQKYRNTVSLYFGVLFNVLYVSFKFISSFIYKSLWMGANAIYYLVITIIRFILLKTHRKNASKLENVKKYNLTGVLLLVLNVAMMGMIYQMVINNETYIYPGYMIYIITLYSFYNIITAIIDVIKYRKNEDDVFSSVKMLSLATATMSIFATQTALINMFGEEEDNRLLMNSITGTAVIVIVLGIAIFMIVNSSKKLHKIRSEKVNGTN